MASDKKESKNDAALWKKKLLTYSSVAGAALSMAAPADAAIHYSGKKDIRINGGQTSQNIDINGDGVNDFVFSLFSNANPPHFTYQSINVQGALAGNSALGDSSWWFFEPYRLDVGQVVSSLAQGAWDSTGALNALSRYTSTWWGYTTTYTYTYGNFIDRSGYIGVRFDIRGNNHYGWIAYEGTGYTEGRITGWAYEDVPEADILAGYTGTASIPTLNQWGIIFLMGLILLEGARRIARTRDRDREKEPRSKQS